MSKSAEDPKGLINILDEDSIITKKIKSAVTDTDGEIRFDRDKKPGVSNLLGIYSAITGDSVKSLEERFSGKGYGDLKSELAEVVVSALAPMRQRAEELLSDKAELDRLLAKGAASANELAEQTLQKVHEKVGFIPPKH
jgi:tryptophanyl-tRNA synthetase